MTSRNLPRIPVQLGGFGWRKARGLLTIGDLSLLYRARRFVREGAMVPLPEDLLPRWRRIQRP